MTLRIDSLLFLCVAAIPVLLRNVPRRVGLAVYATGSLGIWLALGGSWLAVAVGLGFVYLPWLVVRARRNPTTRVKVALFSAQAAQVLVLRGYVDPTWISLGSLPSTLALIGISYMVLRQVEWVLWIDADDDTPLDVLEYTAFVVGFFTLLAGPVMRFRDFRSGFMQASVDRDGFVVAINRIVNGYFKACVFAPVLGELTTQQWLSEHAKQAPAFAAFLLVYPLYVYLNFAGYCDVVIGFARLANTRLAENFAHPFAATNIQEFWQRWHITFSTWIRVHVFFPLVRVLRAGPVALPGPMAMVLAVLMTFTFVGAWHGPSRGFLIFGLMHAIAALAVAPYAWLLERVLGAQGKERYERSHLLRGLRVAACYGYLALSMLFFERQPNDVLEILKLAPW